MMDTRWVVQHSDGKRWLATFGWVPDQQMALGFSSEDEARAYFDQRPSLAAAGHSVRQGLVNEITPGIGTAETEYAIFGTRLHER